MYVIYPPMMNPGKTWFVVSSLLVLSVTGCGKDSASTSGGGSSQPAAIADTSNHSEVLAPQKLPALTHCKQISTAPAAGFKETSLEHVLAASGTGMYNLVRVDQFEATRFSETDMFRYSMSGAQFHIDVPQGISPAAILAMQFDCEDHSKMVTENFTIRFPASLDAKTGAIGSELVTSSANYIRLEPESLPASLWTLLTKVSTSRSDTSYRFFFNAAKQRLVVLKEIRTSDYYYSAFVTTRLEYQL